MRLSRIGVWPADAEYSMSATHAGASLKTRSARVVDTSQMVASANRSCSEHRVRNGTDRSKEAVEDGRTKNERRSRAGPKVIR